MSQDTIATQSQTPDPVRESYSAKYLTDGQYQEAMFITHIVEGEINHSGTFLEKLQDYAHDFARPHKFNAVKAETIVRDLFKARTGETMNQMRERLLAHEKALLGDGDNPSAISEDQRGMAYARAKQIGDLITSEDRIPFYRAYSHQAQKLGKDLGITEMASRKLMQAEFKTIERRELGSWGRELEKQYLPSKQDHKRDHTRDGGQPEASRTYSRSR